MRIDLKYKIDAVNPVSKKEHDSDDSVLMLAKDRAFLNILPRYIAELIKLGADPKQVMGARLLMARIEEYQDVNGSKVPDMSSGEAVIMPQPQIKWFQFPNPVKLGTVNGGHINETYVSFIFDNTKTTDHWATFGRPAAAAIYRDRKLPFYDIECEKDNFELPHEVLTEKQLKERLKPVV